MTKTTDINDIIATRSPELMLSALWDDASMVGKIRSELQMVSADNMKYYHTHFCGSKEVEK